MATVNCVTVLTPNGRRQSVKVTPNSTILQILEEVCTKHNFDPLEFDIRHHSKILDTTMTMQFSRLPNNAQLEMVKAKKIRQESEVLVNVQTESGSRLSGSFLPSESLWDVVVKLCPDTSVANKQPAVLYMRQEICGTENLKSTTLRSLGLTSGRALLRLTYKSMEEGQVPQKQIDVSSKPIRYGAPSVSTFKQPVSAAAPTDSHRTNRTQVSLNKDADFKQPVSAAAPADSHRPNRTQVSLNKDVDVKGAVQKETSNATEPTRLSKTPMKVEGKNSLGVSEKVISGAEGTKQQSLTEDKVITAQKQQSLTEDKVITVQKQHTKASKLPIQSKKHEEKPVSNVQEGNTVLVEEIFDAEIEPRDRNAVVFKHGSHQTSVGEDLPDEFFELTLDEVQSLYRELKDKQTEMNDAPLQTSALRKLEESKKILNNLHKYKRAVLRIQFPNQIILQGSFSPIETIESVKEFVRGYLVDSTMSFHLYTTPPKEILEPSSRLIEVNCVPCALLHFGLPEGLQENVNYLREDVLNELSTEEVATVAATLSRGLPATAPEKRSLPSTSGIQQSRASTSGVQVPKESKETTSSSSKTDTRAAGGPNGKVPKWFKVGPK